MWSTRTTLNRWINGECVGNFWDVKFQHFDLFLQMVLPSLAQVQNIWVDLNLIMLDDVKMGTQEWSKVSNVFTLCGNGKWDLWFWFFEKEGQMLFVFKLSGFAGLNYSWFMFSITDLTILCKNQNNSVDSEAWVSVWSCLNLNCWNCVVYFLDSFPKICVFFGTFFHRSTAHVRQ